MTLDDVMKVVYRLNEKIEDLDIQEGYQFCVYTNGFGVLVYFNEIQGSVAWSSEEDMRELDENDEYEPLETYLIRELKKDVDRRMKIAEGLFTKPSEIDVGDTVYHKPTKETWLVALCENNRVYWCGYPFGGSGDLQDCDLVEKADDDKRLRILRNIANTRGDELPILRAKERMDAGK